MTKREVHVSSFSPAKEEVNVLMREFPNRWRYTISTLHRSINRHVTNMVAENDANLAVTPTFRYVSIESPL
ncbi:hypothetical protein TNCV_3534631 [Trichonephila clavipes]|nr:hypothetical protein TNCV_3534631 [Trichonephila clavipes]